MPQVLSVAWHAESPVHGCAGLVGFPDWKARCITSADEGIMMSKEESGVNCLAKSLNQRQLPLSAELVDILHPQLLSAQSLAATHGGPVGKQVATLPCESTPPELPVGSIPGFAA
jgi:hypothetical protein